MAGSSANYSNAYSNACNIVLGSTDAQQTPAVLPPPSAMMMQNLIVQAGQTQPQQPAQLNSLARIREKHAKLLRMIATYSASCTPGKMIPINALIPDQNDLDECRRIGAYAEIYAQYDVKIEFLKTLLEGSGPSAKSSQHADSSESSGPELVSTHEPSRLNTLQSQPPRIARPRFVERDGKTCPSLPEFHDFLVAHVRNAGRQNIPVWSKFKLRAVYGDAHPNHSGYTTWIGDEPKPGDGRRSVFTVREILKEAFPDLADNAIPLPRAAYAARKSRTYLLRDVCSFLVERMKLLIAQKSQGPQMSDGMSDGMRLAAVLDSEALETAAREQWKDMHISLWRVVDLSKVQKAWEELKREPNTDLTALAATLPVAAKRPKPPKFAARPACCPAGQSDSAAAAAATTTAAAAAAALDSSAEGRREMRG